MSERRCGIRNQSSSSFGLNVETTSAWMFGGVGSWLYSIVYEPAPPVIDFNWLAYAMTSDSGASAFTIAWLPGIMSVPWMRPRRPDRSEEMSPIMSVGTVISSCHERFEQHGLGLLDGIDERLAAGGDERDLLGVHRVVLAVVDLDLDVLQRVAGDRALVHHLTHALLDRGQELPGDGAAEGGVLEDQPVERVLDVSGERLDAKVDLAELAGAAGLLLVAVVPLGLGADRLLVGDPRRTRGDLDRCSGPCIFSGA